MPLTIPTLLTLSRLLLLPVLVWALFAGHVWLGFGLYVFGAITDFLDGWIAREFDQVSAFGTFLDPISDKIYVVTLMMVLVAIGALPDLWIVPVLLILAREFLISGLREYLGPKNITMPVSKLAKWKTAIQMVALAFLIIGPLSPWVMGGGRLLLLSAAGLTLITGWDYLRAGLAHMRDSD